METAVDFFIKELKGSEYDEKDFIFNGVITSELIEEVKKLEKQQIIHAFCDGNPAFSDVANDYYKETYGRTN